MSISLQNLVKGIEPSKTVIFFGAGSSVPSGCPTAKALCERLVSRFAVGSPNMSLAELTGLIELKTKDRRSMIEHIRASFTGKRPTRGLLTLPLFDWKSLYTTNYDELIEISYAERQRELVALSSNFDFSGDLSSAAQKLYKIHGTIRKDRSDGHQASLILTDQDYDDAKQHREFIYDRLASDLSSGQLVVIGYSLADPEIKRVIERISSIQSKISTGGRQCFLSFEEDLDRAEILESRGWKVAFGGVDDFFSELLKQGPDNVVVYQSSDKPLDIAPSLIPLTEDVRHSIEHGNANVSAMFSGRSATYSDITANLTFERDLISRLCEVIVGGSCQAVLIAGASGVGKTTAARQSMIKASSQIDWIWEHKADNLLDPKEWIKVAIRLEELGQTGLLFVDDAHTHLQQLNELADGLSSKSNSSLRVLMAAPRNSWNPRIKSPSLSKMTEIVHLSQLSHTEIDSLLNLAESVPAIRQLVEASFAGFSRLERRRRLVDRCEADTFVCLKNVFASDGFDDIVLSEYAALSEAPRDVYRIVAFLETCGVRVHRQLLIRLLGIPSDSISALLIGLTDIVFEIPVDERAGVYAWRGRHSVISSIIAKYKFREQSEFISMIERVIRAINPTFAIELKSIRELCSIDSGVSSVLDKEEQNRLLRMMISVAPGERVPRHRLIRNLIAAGEYEKAGTEIRIFENDFGADGPVARYRVSLMINRAVRTPGLLLEDRLAILEEAISNAAHAANRFSLNKSVLAAYCEAGLEYFKLSAKSEHFDKAISLLKASEDRIGDPDIARLVVSFEGRMRSGSVGMDVNDELAEQGDSEIA